MRLQMHPFTFYGKDEKSLSQREHSLKPASCLIHPPNKKLPLYREGTRLFLMNLWMNNGCLRWDEDNIWRDVNSLTQ